ncbi:MAG: 4'-phosphopantetheinyl transferase superfamily protein [Anaerohalosphaeraceae bacterium]
MPFCQTNSATISLKPKMHLSAPKPNEVLVYWANLDELTVPSGLLSEAEQVRASQYVHTQDRNRFIVRHSLLRRLLSAFLNRPAHAVSIHCTAEGKPGLNPAEHQSAIQFSLTHSHGIAAFAFTAERRIGIDIEKMDPQIETLPLARQYFTADEASHIACLDGQAQLLAFYQCWTRKEAYLKAAGIRPLDSFDTGLQTDQIVDLHSPEQNNHWAITRLELVPGWFTSLVVETGERQPISVIAQCIQNSPTIE